jgi:predicted DNA-binding protein
LEDFYLALATMENVRLGKEKVHSAKGLRKDLKLDEPEPPKASRRG